MKTNSYDLLRVPIILLMICVLYNESEAKSLPERRTELYQNLYELMMDGPTLKSHNYGYYSSKIQNVQDMLLTLGRFAWEALQRDIRQLLIVKVNTIDLIILVKANIIKKLCDDS